MKKLSAVIREIRKRHGETQGQFAKRLGVGYAAVSRYESDKLSPGRAVLIHLLSLAESAGEQETVRKAIGELPPNLAKEEAFIALARDVEAELNQIISQKGTSIATRQDFRDLVVDAIGQKYLPLWLVEMLRLWRRHRDDREAEQAFNDSVSTLDRQLSSRGKR